MRRPELTIVSLILGILTTLSAAADKPRTLPPPRWHVSLDPLFGTHPKDTGVTLVDDVILVSHYPEVIAVDQANGRELWRRGEPAVESAKRPQTTTSWRLLSSGQIDGVGPAALLLRTRGVTIRDSSFPGGEHSTAEYSEEALNAITGQVLWRSPTDVYCSSTLVGDLVVNISNLEAPGRTKTLRCRDAATGAVFSETNAQARASIQRAIRRKVKNSLFIGNPSALWSLNIEAGTATNLHNATGYLLAFGAFPDQERVVLHNNADDDFVGHSVWPKYVECVGLSGARQSTFPPELHFAGIEDEKTIPESYSIGSMTPCRVCGTVLCVSDKVGREGKFWWYGLDVRDGKILWKNAIVDEPPVTAECGTGFLVIVYRDTARGKVNLEWMEGRSGKLLRIGPAPNSAMMAVSGPDLFVVDPSGNLLAYSLEAILPAVTRKRH